MVARSTAKATAMPDRFPPIAPQDQITPRVHAHPTPNLPWGELLVGTIALYLMLVL
jgi:hypothetical protein